VIWITRGQLKTFCSQLKGLVFIQQKGWEADSRSEGKWNQVPQVHGVTTWPSSSVEVEWLLFLVPVKDEAEVPIGSAGYSSLR
jgi:hypothetical protein